MTTSIGGLSTSVIAVIAVGAVGALLILITVVGFCCDLPARLRRRRAAQGGRTSPEMNEVDMEKNEPSISVTDVNSQGSQYSKSTRSTRAPSLLCTCEHPNPITNQTAVHSPQIHLRP
ncbi:hypothetical protein IQ06DRAFT_348009 [Phaeosphaeriaceae sp. SRC1lsM3a]|nr:hypothetical protein IQ06DRAFT_348009 [Stagonospora sp. SRC1lsM3a]